GSGLLLEEAPPARVEASDSRSQIRGRDKSVLDDISPLPGTVGLRTVLRYAPFLEEWSTKHADARRNCDRLLTGSCTMDAWLAQCGFWRKVGEMQKQMGPRSIKCLTRLALPRGLEPLFSPGEGEIQLLDSARRTRSSMTSTARLAKASFCGLRARSTTFVLGPCCGSKNG